MIAVPDIAITQFWPLLIDGDYDTLTALFGGEPVVDDPRVGRIEGEELFATYVAASSKWLTRHQARIEPGATIVTQFHAAAEVLLHLQTGAVPVTLPVVVVADRTMFGGFAYLRIYHSLWPLHHLHVARPPLLPGWTTLQLPQDVSEYREALAAGDVAAVLRQFTATASVREPGNFAFTHCGTEELRCFFDTLLTPGGIELDPCIAIDDGERCVLEYNVTRWGRVRLQSQPGAAVFERSSTGLLQAVRLYDDIELPAVRALIGTAQGSRSA